MARETQIEKISELRGLLINHARQVLRQTSSIPELDRLVLDNLTGDIKAGRVTWQVDKGPDGNLIGRCTIVTSGKGFSVTATDYIAYIVGSLPQP